MDYLATFYTHYGAMRFYKHCLSKGLAARMAPVPRELSASCGVCVRFADAAMPSPAEHEDMERCYMEAADGAYLTEEFPLK